MQADYLLYGTQDCHLCEVAEAIIVKALEGLALHIEVIDIATDSDLINRYGESIPVLASASNPRELMWPFEFEDVIHFLAQ